MEDLLEENKYWVERLKAKKDFVGILADLKQKATNLFSSTKAAAEEKAAREIREEEERKLKGAAENERGMAPLSLLSISFSLLLSFSLSFSFFFFCFILLLLYISNLS